MRYELTIIGTAGLPAAYGGFETLAEHLVGHFAEHRRVQVFCSATKGAGLRPSRYRNAHLRYLRLNANGWQSIFYDAVSLFLSARRSQVLLILGVSGCLFLPIVRLFAPKTRIVTNIDGIEWKREKWGRIARAVLRASERVAVRRSDVVIADNKGIQEHVWKSYARPSTLIAYGGAFQVRDERVPPSSDSRFAQGEYFLTVCRIEPENNIHTILEAFSLTPTANLVLVGNWDTSTYGQEQRSRYSHLPNIQLLDPIYDQMRIAALRKGARGCIHGHSAGGTNPSLVEAMAEGMAVLAYDVSYNRYTTEDQAFYWASMQELAALLTTVTETDLARTARSLMKVATREYTWSRILSQYEAVLFS